VYALWFPDIRNYFGCSNVLLGQQNSTAVHFHLNKQNLVTKANKLIAFFKLFTTLFPILVSSSHPGFLKFIESMIL